MYFFVVKFFTQIFLYICMVYSIVKCWDAAWMNSDLNLTVVKKHIYALFVAITLGTTGMRAQDLHYSQFYLSTLNLNPSMIGIFPGDVRVGTQMRSQWYVNNLGQYRTFTAQGAYKTGVQPYRPHFLTLGLVFNYDYAGDSKLSLTHLGFSGSYSYILNPSNIVSGGVIVGIHHRRFRLDDLLWDNQWNGEVVDPSLPSGEIFDLLSRTFLDLGAGLNYVWQKSYRKKVHAGLGILHLNRPQVNFDRGGQSIHLSPRFALHANATWPLLDQLDILGHGLFQFQNPYRELVLGGYARFHINKQRGKELMLLLGLSHRFGDAVIPKIAVEWSNWYVGLSYDITTSDFARANGRLGGAELSVFYRIVHVPALQQSKICPIY